ncbi:MAG TPA: hypothetical protein VHT70_01225 [Candidatus Saccharimonadales bacterium]|jgi:hypothetical protein|nr:hypothetical protein [Candidatus Saccharimonadales bacterium]
MIPYIVAAAVVVLVAVAIIVLRRPRTLKVEHFQKKWKELQANLRDKATWPVAIMNADKLLDEALKKKRVGGSSTGERLVAAQRMFTDNDGVWSAHKLRNKVEQESDAKLKEAEVKDALVDFRQALKDLGALGDGKQRNS